MPVIDGRRRSWDREVGGREEGRGLRERGKGKKKEREFEEREGKKRWKVNNR